MITYEAVAKYEDIGIGGLGTKVWYAFLCSRWIILSYIFADWHFLFHKMNAQTPCGVKTGESDDAHSIGETTLTFWTN